jgi:tetratricopeptide (TPR) repeat protein
MYERAVAADPNHANSLGDFANFLRFVRGDQDRAEEMYERAVAADPNHANNLGNYAGLLYSLGRMAEARALVERARSLEEIGRIASLRLEILLYELSDDELTADEWRSTIKAIAAELRAGGRSAGWNFELNLRRAEELGRSPDELDFLRTLADVIGEKAGLSELDRFAEWPAGEG